MSEVDWITELRNDRGHQDDSPDGERGFLKEVLCFLKRVPIGEDFQNALDIDFPPTRGLLEQQVEAGMENWAVGLHEGAGRDEQVWIDPKRRDDYPVALKKRWRGDQVGRSIQDMSWVEAKTGFYFLDTYDEDMTERKREQGYFVIFYYDADTKQGSFIHHAPDFRTTLKYRLARRSYEDSTTHLQNFIQTNWFGRKPDEEPPYDCLDLFYLGRECKPILPPLGIFNWSW
tara:strand:+ start:13910 stop:14599 length:690 start_codon:yes stop_codon:yes gene_type:complete